MGAAEGEQGYVATTVLSRLPYFGVRGTDATYVDLMK